MVAQAQKDSRQHFSAVMAAFLEWTEMSHPRLVRAAFVIVADRLSVGESQIKLARRPLTFRPGGSLKEKHLAEDIEG